MKWFALMFFLMVGGAMAQEDNTKTAVFAGGCFWCMEKPYESLPGVIDVVSGYIGGSAETANYKSITSGQTDHYEAVRVTYDPQKVSYQQLLEVFWPNIDPFDNRGQFCDKGPQYRAAIFYLDEAQRQAAVKSKAKVEAALGQPVVTEILPASPFYAAEDYHQDYYKENPVRYKFYRWNCGRDARLEAVWQGITLHLQE